MTLTCCHSWQDRGLELVTTIGEYILNFMKVETQACHVKAGKYCTVVIYLLNVKVVVTV